jgi:SAM-dependent methyltransferase
LTCIALTASFMCRASMQITGKLAAAEPSHGQGANGPRLDADPFESQSGRNQERGNRFRARSQPCLRTIRRSSFSGLVWDMDRGDGQSAQTLLASDHMGELDRHLDRQRAAFGSLISRGVYRSGQIPPAALLGFFEEVLSSVLDPSSNQLYLLDCGCGAGSWLKFLNRKYGDRLKLYGTDVTPGMVSLAKQTLGGSALVQVADLLEASGYRFKDGRSSFDVIYAYDVVQQIPRQRQFRAVDMMLAHIVEGGTVVIFDHDRDTIYGRKMALKKLLTKYTLLPFVPRYYCNATYPPLSHIGKSLRGVGYQTEIIRDTGAKRALIVTN